MTSEEIEDRIVRQLDLMSQYEVEIGTGSGNVTEEDLDYERRKLAILERMLLDKILEETGDRSGYDPLS